MSGVIDIAGLKKIASDDDAFIAEILTLYSDRTKKDLEELTEAEREENWDAIQFVVHRMRSAAVPLGIKDLLVHLKKIELNLKQDNLTDIHTLLETIHELSNLAIQDAVKELNMISV